MKRFVKKVALFVVLMPIVILVLIVSWGMVMPSVIHDNILFLRGSNSFLYQRVREAEQYKNSDVLVLGASHAYREIDPTIFKNKGYKLFNLGSSSQTPLQTRILLNRYLSTLNPHVILYEVYPEVFCMDGVESALDLISNDRVELDFLTMSLAIHDIKPYLSLIYSYFRQVFALDAHKSIPDTLSGDMYVSGGFVRKKMEMFNPPDKFTLVSWEINQIQWEEKLSFFSHLSLNLKGTV